MTAMNLNVAHTSDGVSTQLKLVRPRRERTDEDRHWYSEQLSVKHEKRVDGHVYERMAYYGSLNPERIAFPSVARVAREAKYSERSVRYALRRLETDGRIECLTRKGGRNTSRYRVVGLADCSPGGQKLQPRAATVAPEVLREGSSVSKNKEPSLTTDTAKSIDPALVEKIEKEIGVDCLQFPSQEQEPSADGEYQHKKQVGMLCAVARKLGREVTDYEAQAFDRLSHERKILTLKPLLEAEQRLAVEGVVAAPPKAAPSPRHEIVHHHEGKSTRTRPVCTEHRWTPPASDGIQNCFECDEEKLGEVNE